MVFQMEWLHLQITILSLQMNWTPWRGEKCTGSLTEGEWFHMGSPSYRMHKHTHRHACMSARKHTGCHCTLDRICKRQNHSITEAPTGRGWASGEAVKRGMSFPLCGHADTFYYFSFSVLLLHILSAWIGDGNCKASLWQKSGQIYSNSTFQTILAHICCVLHTVCKQNKKHGLYTNMKTILIQSVHLQIY